MDIFLKILRYHTLYYKEKKAKLNTIKFTKNKKGSDRNKIDNIIETNNNNDKSIKNRQKIRAKKRKTT